MTPFDIFIEAIIHGSFAYLLGFTHSIFLRAQYTSFLPQIP